jgi:PAS domain S-box-containing protein
LRAVGPIWLMAVTGILIGGALLLALVASLSTLRAANGKIATLRSALSTAWSGLHTQLTADRARFESILLGKEVQVERTDVSASLVALFRSLELDETFAPLVDDLDHRLRQVTALLDEASAWRTEVSAADMHYRQVFDAYWQAAQAIRQALQQLDGIDRLRMATMTRGGKGLDGAEPGTHRLALPALVELLHLTTVIEQVRRNPTPDACYNFEHNELRPTLQRLELLVEARAQQGEGGEVLLALIRQLSRSLLGDAPDRERSSESLERNGRTSGLLSSLHDQNRIRLEAQMLSDRAHRVFAACESARQKTQEYIDQTTLRLRNQVTSHVEHALSVSWAAAGSACLILVAVAVSLSRVTIHRTSVLEQTLHDLRESRLKLVDIEQLREANRRSELLNRELLFQKAALDQACIYTETDAEGRITYANEAFCALNGYTREEILGNTHRMFNSGVHSDEFWAQMYRDLGERGVWRGIVCNRTKHGELYWTHMTNVAFKDEHGRLIRCASIRTNITEQIRAQEAQAELERFARATVDALQSQVAIVDENGRIIAVNEAWRSFAASNGGGCIGVGDNYLQSCERATSGCDDARLMAEGILSVIRGERSHFAMEYPCHSPTERRWFMMRVTRFPGDGPTRVVISHENITETRLANEQLKAQAVELRKAREVAESASRAKSEFLAMMSHEIRTPLNGVVGALELLEVAGMTPEQGRYAGIARASALSLLSIINDILDFSKIEAGKLEMSHRECSPVVVFEKVMEIMSIRAAEKGLELVCAPSLDLPARISVDEDRLRQILINLVGNAVKFTSRGRVTLRATSAPDPNHPGAHRIRVSISRPLNNG